MRKQTLAAAIASLLAAGSSAVNAVEFELLDGELVGQLNSSISLGHMWRVENRKDSGDEFANGQNANDGNSNFDKGLVSQVLKFNSELTLNYNNFGALVRVLGFYDKVIMDDDISDTGIRNIQIYRNNTIRGASADFGFTEATKDEAGSDFRLMDAYVYGDFEYAEDKFMQVRLGRQVMSWGESLFMRNGISTANNPIYVAQARQPAVELKDIFIPLNTLSLSMDVTDGLSLEAYYQFEWEENHLDAHGTYFSITDNFGPGAVRAIANLGSSDTILGFVGMGLLPGDFDTRSYYQDAAIKTQDIDPADENQYGIALRYYSESLDTEFSFYHISSHATVPAINATAGDDHTCMNLNSADPNFRQLGGNANLATDAGVSRLCDFGLSLLNSGNTLLADQGQQVVALSNALGYLGTTTYKATFPEDIKLYGFSFSTTVGDTSLAGEIAYRENDVIFTDYEDNALAAHVVGSVIKLSAGIPGDLGIGNGGNDLVALSQGDPTVTGCAAEGKGSTNFGPLTGYVCAGDSVDLFERTETWNGSMVAIHNFGAGGISDRTIALLEVGASYIPDAKPFQSALGNRQTTTNVFGNYISAGLVPEEMRSVVESLANPENPNDDYADDYLDKFSWGYRAVLALTYNDVMPGLNVTPSLRWAHDVKGNSVRSGNFMEDRQSLSVGVNGVYNLNWELGLNYTSFMGAEGRNEIIDRDNVSFNVKYGF